MKRSLIIFAIASLAALSTAGLPFSTYAASKVVVPDAIPNAGIDASIPPLANQAAISKSNKSAGSDVSAQAASSIIAILTVYSDPTYSNALAGRTSSNLKFTYDTGMHSWITIKNLSNSPIQMGKFSGIPYGKTMAFGKWGIDGEPHLGIWYNREAQLIYRYGAYPNRVSVSWGLDATGLSRINSFIINNDSYSWLKNNNCSTFAAAAWNSVVGPEGGYTLSAGTVFPSTPKKLATSIQSKYADFYRIGTAVPWDYSVYYANRTGAPIKAPSAYQ